MDHACDTSIAAGIIYNAHNTKFIEYASNPDLSRAVIGALTGQDLRFAAELLQPE